MTLPASGAIAFSDINVELNYSSTAQISLNDSAVRTLFSIASGSIDMNTGHGKSATLGYIEDIFSTYLYTGTGATQSIVNGIDLSTKGGMVWRKQRDATADHFLADTVRGTYSTLSSNTTAAASGSSYIGFLSNGFQAVNSNSSNPSGALKASCTFRKQPKFFDVVTYTGTGSNTTIAHNLGSVPGCIMVKRTDATGGWGVYHNSLTSAAYRLLLNSAAIQVSDLGYWNSTDPTSTVFSIGNTADVNASGGTYVAYIFAHNAGGFGLTGTDNVISCGSFSVVSGAASVTLGYEPQYIMYKNKSGTIDDWTIMDNMRGFNSATGQPVLFPNKSNAESSYGYALANATGFTTSGATDATYIYIAIRRGPMKVPTLGTQVYNAIARTGTSAVATVTGVGFPPDIYLEICRTPNGGGNHLSDRLRGTAFGGAGTGNFIDTSSTAGEFSATGTLTSFDMDGVTLGSDPGTTWINTTGKTTINWFFRRYPNVVDEVCYTGTGSATTQTHNLGVIPELIIIKNRNSSSNWPCYNSTLGATNYIYLNDSAAYGTTSVFWGNTTPTSSVFSLGSGNANVNASGTTYVAYLFATCAGVSKVGTYTGNGSTQAIACGFAGGARFVLIKRTDSTGDWYVYDTARGMTTLTDPYLLLNSTAAETATLGSVTTTTGGFTVNAAVLAAINTNSATYIFLAIA